MRVLVTGATGFIGKRITARLCSRYEVLAACRREAPRDVPNVEWLHIPDIRRADWKSILSGVHYVVHLAALAHQVNAAVDESEYDSINHVATKRLAGAIAETPSVKRLVFVSSIGAVCSNSTEPVNESTPCRPDSAYGRSKRAAELALAEALKAAPADWCILRPALVYGPGNPGNMLRLTRLVRLRAPLPFGAIRNRRTFLYLENLADAVELCLQAPAASRRTFNLSDGVALSTPELLRMIGRALGIPVRLVPVPFRLLCAFGKAGDLGGRLLGRSIGLDTYSLERLTSSLEVDITGICSALNWRPPDSPSDAIQRAFETRSAPQLNH